MLILILILIYYVDVNIQLTYGTGMVHLVIEFVHITQLTKYKEKDIVIFCL